MSPLPPLTEKPPFEEWYRRGRRVHVAAVTGPPFPAVLLENCGKIAAKQTKYVVRVATDPDDPEERMEFETSEDNILLDVDGAERGAAPITTATTIDPAGRIVIPKRLRDELGLKAGEKIELSAVDGRLEIGRPTTPMRP